MSITMGQLASRFAQASQKVQPNADRQLQTFAQVGVGFVKSEIQNVHAVDTGTMLNSTEAERVDSETYLVGPTVSYAPYVALGTSRVAARPFHTKAAQKLSDQISKHFKDFPDGLGV